MALQIIPFQSSLNTCYIIRDKGAVLIDGAWPNEAKLYIHPDTPMDPSAYCWILAMPLWVVLRKINFLSE